METARCVGEQDDKAATWKTDAVAVVEAAAVAST
jgi:hypothetical protein